MWIVKPFKQKESSSLEGRTIDIGNVKVNVRNAIAEGGFSCVYLARDALNPSKQFALKHMICQDGESLELVTKEISVMKMLKGHPNVVTLVAHTIFDMGRTKEALLVMEFCEKSLVTVLENRGAGYFEEKQLLAIFRDICNAVFAMHCQSPPIAHRDIKAENVLLGADGAWKLCDFGSTSTNHKRFDKPEEMGIEEDNIRKHTTPAYRAPEMWDLFRREVISEKVDIWALGCLLYRICYFKSAFDGESKLQILNGNYHIPELPKYTASVTGLIKDMLEASPDARPDITQIWFRVNDLLPINMQKNLPDGSGLASTVNMQPPVLDVRNEGIQKRTPTMPRRAPPPPPSSRDSGKELQHSGGGGTGALGVFWSTPYAQDSHLAEDRGPVFDEQMSRVTSRQSHKSPETIASPPREQHVRRNIHGNSKRFDENSSEDFEIKFFGSDSESTAEKRKAHADTKSSFQNASFNSFVADFDHVSKLNSRKCTINPNSNSRSEDIELETEVSRLREQLKQANLEKTEMTSKYEKLSAICRSQRQEIQDLKRALASSSSPSTIDSSKSQISPGSSQPQTPPREKIEGTVWELQQGLFASSPATLSPEPKPWQPFAEEPRAQPVLKINNPKSVGTTNGHRRPNNHSATSTTSDAWGFGQDNFTAVPGGSEISKVSDQGTSSQRFSVGETKKAEPKQPAGWAGF